MGKMAKGGLVVLLWSVLSLVPARFLLDAPVGTRLPPLPTAGPRAACEFSFWALGVATASTFLAAVSLPAFGLLTRPEGRRYWSVAALAAASFVLASAVLAVLGGDTWGVAAALFGPEDPAVGYCPVGEPWYAPPCLGRQLD